MTCLGRSDDLNAFIDGELSIERTAVVAGHVAECPACALDLAELARLREALARVIPRKEVSSERRAQIEAALRLETTAKAEPRPAPAPRPIPRLVWTAAVAALTAALLIAVFGHGHDEGREFMAVRDALLRSQSPQLNRGAASVPRVPGFSLAYSRTDVLAGHPAEVAVYRSRAGSVALCTWPANGEAAHSVRSANYQGTEIRYWNDGKTEFWAVSAAPGPELDAFVRGLAPG